MANISEAWGTVTVLSENDYEKLFEALNNAQYGWWDYNFEITDIEGNEGNFYGNGRWSFENNLEDFGKWLQNTIIQENYFDPDGSKAQDAMDAQYYLLNTTWSVVFDFKDVEPGCQVAYEATWCLSHQAGRALKDIKAVQTYFKSYDFDFFNLVGNLEMDYEDALSNASGYCIEEIPKDELENQLEELNELDTHDDYSNSIKNNCIMYVNNLLTKATV